MSYDPKTVTERLDRLQGLKPEWAVDFTAEKGQPVLKIFVYAKPVILAAPDVDLIEIREVRFPVRAWGALYTTPIDWLDEQIRRLATRAAHDKTLPFVPFSLLPGS